MSVYQEMRQAATKQIVFALKSTNVDAIKANMLAGVIYALLAIAAAIADLKP